MRLGATPSLSTNYYAYTPATAPTTVSTNWADLLKQGLQTALAYKQQKQMLDIQKAQLETQQAQQRAAILAAQEKQRAAALQAQYNAARVQGAATVKQDFVPLLLVGGGLAAFFLMRNN